MIFTDLYLAGIGTADVGAVTISHAIEAGWYDEADATSSGLESISIAGEIPAPDLAVTAARNALARSGHKPEEISGLFHTNVHPQGPDGWSAQHYINHRSIDQPVTSVEIHNGCVGFLSALSLASCYLQASNNRTAVLLTAADNFNTPAVDRWRTSRLFVLADGGGAVVLSRRAGFARLLAIGATSRPELEAHHRGAEQLFPPAMTVGGTLNFDERMAYGQRLAEQGLAPEMGEFGNVLVHTVEHTLKEVGLTIGDLDRVVHDGFALGPLQAIFLDPLGLPIEHGIWAYTRQVGHAGPLDQIRGLEWAWQNGYASRGDRVLLVSGAPGMEAACAVLEIAQSYDPTRDEAPTMLGGNT